MVAARFQLPAQFLVIVNLAVKYHPQGLVFVGHGLMTALQVDHLQAAHAQAHILIQVKTLVVGAAVHHGLTHLAQQRRGNPLLFVLVDLAGYPAHRY